MEAPTPQTIAEEVSDVWSKAWQRELGLDATLTGAEQGKLNTLMFQAEDDKNRMKRAYKGEYLRNIACGLIGSFVGWLVFTIF